MNTSHYVKCACRVCGQHIEFNSANAGESIKCPGCEAWFQLYIPLASAPPLPIVTRIPPATERIPILPAPAAPAAMTVEASIETKSETMGLGCLLQLIGICLLFWFPIGTIMGICLLLMGSRAARKPICGNCRNLLSSRSVSICPACHAILT